MNQELTDLIREQAYQLWLEQGKPSGQDFAHWLQAEALVLAQLSREEEKKQATTRVKPSTPKKKSSAKKKRAVKKKSAPKKRATKKKAATKKAPAKRATTKKRRAVKKKSS